MVINQLFKKRPSLEFINRLVYIYGFSDVDDTDFSFSKKSLEQNDIVSKINEIKDELKDYYILCKGNIYMNNITISRTITILRQFLKTIKYTLTSKERYINSKKYLFYSIISIEKKKEIQKEKELEQARYIVTFD